MYRRHTNLKDHETVYKPSNSKSFPESATPSKAKTLIEAPTRQALDLRIIEDEESRLGKGLDEVSDYDIRHCSSSGYPLRSTLDAAVFEQFELGSCHTSSSDSGYYDSSDSFRPSTVDPSRIDPESLNTFTWSDDCHSDYLSFLDNLDYERNSWSAYLLAVDQIPIPMLPPTVKTDVQTVREISTKDPDPSHNYIQLDNSDTSQNLPSAALKNHHDQKHHAISGMEHSQDSGPGDVMRRVDEAKRALFVSVPPVTQGRTTTTGVDSSPAVTLLPILPRDTSVKPSRELILEILQIMEDEDTEYDALMPTHTDPITGKETDDTYSSVFMGPTSDAGDSPKGSTASSSDSLGVASKTTASPSGRSSERDEPGDDPPRKKQNRDREFTISDALQPFSYAQQMPCPFLELDGCQGTNTTISELMRSLANRHRKVICNKCCTLLSVPEEDKKPLNMLQKHASEPCEPRCIGTSCSTEPAGNVPYHRRTGQCPTWQTLSKEVRWKFIWTLVSPQLEPPVPNFEQGPGYEHSSHRRPCKQQSRARVKEICTDLWRDIEAKEKRISTLEHELSTSNEQNTQMQQKHDNKVRNLENIIETLLERLSDKAIDVPRALRRRLRQECPTIIVDEPVIPEPADHYERPSLEGGDSFVSFTEPVRLSPLGAFLRQEPGHDATDHDASAETLLYNRPTWHPENLDVVAVKEESNMQYRKDTPKRAKIFHLRDWVWEITAAVFSLTCLVAIIIVLRTHQEKSLASWHFVYDITLNTLVALLSTLSRTALIVPVASCISQLKWIHLVSSPRPLRELQIFDDASRGPWGSLELIWRLHFRTKLATWGALITIVSLTMGPLSQQLLSYPSRLTFRESGAIFYRAQVYDSGGSRGDGIGANKDVRMDPKMQGAILNGLYNLSSPVQIECQTGNCQWDPYTTLAIASKCENVSSATEVDCTFEGRMYHCNYISPGGFDVHAYSLMAAANGWATRFNSTARTPSRDEGPLTSNLVLFAAVNALEPYSMEAPDVTECEMRWVAQSVQNTTVINGTFHPGITQNFELNYLDNPDLMDTFSVSNEATTFPGNRSFAMFSNDNSEIMGFLKGLFSSTITDPFGLALQNSTDLSETMAMISDSMTYAMGHGPSGIELPGQTIITEQYIRVNWGWIGLPIGERWRAGIQTT
ncbi:hypothetical protein DDE82_007996 [Stemphylium lycopersici]|nr:hypothetical protein DDE82_007996 [Stemphylium lycopersici]